MPKLNCKLKLSPDMWNNGRFPSMDEYREILKRGCMLYSLDMDSRLNGANVNAIDPVEASERPCNLLYITCLDDYGREDTQGFKGPARNEYLLKSISKQKEYISEVHSYGIPVIIYQNENNFDQAVFSEEEIKAMAAELEPFVWGFGNEGRRFACYNKPAWRDYLIERLILRVGQTGGDGVFMDNNTPFMHCRCEVCRKKYADRFGSDLYKDMGNPDTVVADMRVFDYVGTNQVPKDLVRVDNRNLMRYLEWRIDCIIEFQHEIRNRLEEAIGRQVIYTANGHIGIAEQSAVLISDAFDMVFSEDGFSAPPISNGFNLRLGTSMGEGERSAFILTRVTESAPVADMVKVLNAEGMALGGQAEFWDFHIRFDDRLKEAQRSIRQFFCNYSKTVFSIEQDLNEIAIVYSWRSDLWTSQAISPAKMFAALLEDINQPYDVLIAERNMHADRLERYKLIILPNVEILSDYWYEKIQNYLQNGGKVISTGTSAKLDENLEPRKVNWYEANWCHFDELSEKKYFSSRKGIGIHSGYTRPSNILTDTIDNAIPEPSLKLENAQPLLTLNHTSLFDGEAVHLVNRYVNVFPFIHSTPRKQVTLLVMTNKNISKVEWLSPDDQEMVLNVEKTISGVRITIPELKTYGIVRLYY